MSSPKRLALITGASSGIGREVALKLASLGYETLLAARRMDRLEALARQIQEQHGTNAVPLSFDIQIYEECAKALSPFVDSIDVLINCAGVGKSTEPFHKIEISAMDQMIRTNLCGVLYVTRLALPGMVKRNAGHIVNIGSASGRWCSSRSSVYNATKHALLALTESWRLDLAGTDVRVSNIEPGLTRTEFAQVRFGSPERAEKMFEGIQLLAPSDVAEAVAWTLSRPAGVTVQEVVIFPNAQTGAGPVTRRRPGTSPSGGDT